MKSKTTKKVKSIPAIKTYAEVIELNQQEKLLNPTMTEKWLLGCYNYYRSLLAIEEDKTVAEKWWKGCIKSYNKRIIK